MPARPQDDYNPVPTVAPTTGMSNDYASVRANPNDFGANVGEKLQEGGKTLETVGNQAMDIAIQQQGMLNETNATNAASQADAQYGMISGKYTSLEGLNAVHGRDQAVTDMLAVRQNVRKTLDNPAAQRAFDLMVVRREGYELQNVNTHYASQVKAADNNSALSSMNLAIDQAATPGLSDEEFNNQLGNIQYQAVRLATNHGFDENGIKEYTLKAQGEAWKKRVLTTAFDANSGSITKAVQMLQDHKDQIPSAVYAELSQQFNGPLRNEQARTIGLSVGDKADQDYLKFIGSPSDKYDEDTRADIFIRQESQGSKTTNLGQIQPETWKSFSRPGEDISNAHDNREVTKRYLKYLSDLPQINGDPERIAVAYFSGPGNVSPVGSLLPYIDGTKHDNKGKTVASYVSDIRDKFSAVPTTKGEVSSYISKADFLESHYSDYVKMAQDESERLHPGDATAYDSATRYAENWLNTQISTQRISARASLDTVMQYVRTNGITDTNQLNSSPVSKAWISLQTKSVMGANAVDRYIHATTRGQVNSFGTDFFDYHNKVLSGQITDPAELSKALGGDKNALLTPKGFDVLRKEIQDVHSTQGAGFAHAEQQFLKRMHDEITGEAAFPGIPNTYGQANYDKFIMSVMPWIERAKAKLKDPNSGVSIADYFTDTKSPAYIGKNAAAYTRTEGQLTLDFQRSTLEALAKAKVTPPKQNTEGIHTEYKTLNEIKAALDRKELTRQQAEDMAHRHKLLRVDPVPPPVPGPSLE